jgi:hypothetical protein
LIATGRKWYWMFGHSNSALLRMKPPASNWLLAEQQPLGADRRLVPPVQRRVQRHRLLAGVLQVHLQVVLEVLADPGQLVHQRDVEVAQQRGRADPGALEDLR